jgi:hypothetical protein
VRKNRLRRCVRHCNTLLTPHISGYTRNERTRVFYRAPCQGCVKNFSCLNCLFQCSLSYSQGGTANEPEDKTGLVHLLQLLSFQSNVPLRFIFISFVHFSSPLPLDHCRFSDISSDPEALQFMETSGGAHCRFFNLCVFGC